MSDVYVSDFKPKIQMNVESHTRGLKVQYSIEAAAAYDTMEGNEKGASAMSKNQSARVSTRHKGVDNVLVSLLILIGLAAILYAFFASKGAVKYYSIAMGIAASYTAFAFIKSKSGD